MKPISFPGGRTPTIPVADTIRDGDFAVITFTDPGFFSHNSDQVFSPDLPTGYMGVQGGTNTVIVSGTAQNVGNIVTLSFLDHSNGNLYIDVLTVV